MTFDSGGLSLKPSASMEDMKSDMTGAAVVLADDARPSPGSGCRSTSSATSPITENMTGGRAMKLGDVLTMRNGKTVEVLNTDAEGRLILADALSYAAEQKPAADPRPRHPHRAPASSPSGPRSPASSATTTPSPTTSSPPAKATGERTWRLPLDDDLPGTAQEPVADLKNVGGKWGGAITAAKFLEQFVGEHPLGPPRHRRPELGRLRERDPRRRRDRLLRPDPGRPGRVGRAPS